MLSDAFNLLSLLRNWSPPKCIRQAVLKLLQVKPGFIKTSRLQAPHRSTLSEGVLQWCSTLHPNRFSTPHVCHRVGSKVYVWCGKLYLVNMNAPLWRSWSRLHAYLKSSQFGWSHQQQCHEHRTVCKSCLIDDRCQMLSLTVRSVRLGASQLSWTDASLSGTSWRPWCSCCRYTLYNTCPDNISRVPTYLHDCAAWSGRWCYCCCFRMWFQPRCRWSVWSNQMSSGIRRWHTSASGRRRTAWASRWVSQLLLARVLQVSFILTYAFTELHLMYWEGPEMILELQKLLWIWNICPLLEKDFLLTWWSMRSL